MMQLPELFGISQTRSEQLSTGLAVEFYRVAVFDEKKKTFSWDIEKLLAFAGKLGWDKKEFGYLAFNIGKLTNSVKFCMQVRDVAAAYLKAKEGHGGKHPGGASGNMRKA